MKNNSILKISPCLFLVLIYVLSVEFLVAQEKNIYEIKSHTLASKVSTNKKGGNDRKEFYNLAFNLAPTAYLEGNTEKNTYGEGSFRKINIADTNSFEYLLNNQNKYKSAEIIIIKVSSFSELSMSFDLTGLTELSHLKYVYIKCHFKCQKRDVQNFVKVNPIVRVYYNAQIPS